MQNFLKFVRFFKCIPVGNELGSSKYIDANKYK